MATASPPPPVIPFTGIPRLPKKLPHRNWFIAAAVVSLPSYLYYDDRKQAAQLKQAFIDRVSHLADQPLPEGAVGNVRKVTVYAGRWPGEEDGKAAAWFKRYVKPYLVAAAVDYTLPDLPNYSSLVQHVATKAHDLRLAAVSPPKPMLTPTQLSLEQEYAREVEGGVILVGRHSLKGYLEGLRKGWLGERDDESWVAALDDSIFDDPAKPPPSDSASSSQDEPAPAASEPQVSLFPLTHLPASKVPSLATPSVPTTLPPALPPVPSTLPALPPLLLLPYHPELGFSSIPRSIASFFNTRADVQLGGDAAMAFILGQPQTPFAAPSDLEHFEPSLDVRHEQGQGAAGLDFDLEVGEARVPGNFEKTPAQIDERMTTYYEGLKAKVAKAWEIKNGRELTDAEVKNPPATLETLREDRVKKERRARQDRDGYRILRKGSGVTWDERFRDRWSVWDPLQRSPDW